MSGCLHVCKVPVYLKCICFVTAHLWMSGCAHECVQMIRKAICRKQPQLSKKDETLPSTGINVSVLSVCVSYDVANV